MEQSDLLRYVVDTLETLGIRYFITGSHAAMQYGEPRLTNDIDVVVELAPRCGTCAPDSQSTNST